MLRAVWCSCGDSALCSTALRPVLCSITSMHTQTAQACDGVELHASYSMLAQVRARRQRVVKDQGKGIVLMVRHTTAFLDKLREAVHLCLHSREEAGGCRGEGEGGSWRVGGGVSLLGAVGALGR